MHKNERAYADAMGCTWMTKDEGRQAIPPAYTCHVGTLMRYHMEQEAARQWADDQARRAGDRWHGPEWRSEWPIDVSPQGRLGRLIAAEDEALS